MPNFMSNTARLLLLGVASLSLVACDGFGSGNSNAPSSSTPTGNVSSDTDPVVTPDPEVVEPRVTVLETLFEGIAPGEQMTGTARFDGETFTTLPGQFATISDNSADSYETYTPAIRALQPGRYRLSAVLRQPMGRMEQALVRIDPVGNDAATRMDVLISADGTAGRTNGPITDVVVEDNADRFYNVTLQFEVDAASSGEYRFVFYPAAGADNKFMTEATGSLTVGDIKLERLG